MAELIRFEFRRASDEAVETVSVTDDGQVQRAVSGGSAAAPSGAREIGWWRGEVETSVVDMIRALPGASTANDNQLVPSAVGEWWAIIDDVQRRTADDGALAAILSVSSSAATTPETVVSASAWTEEWEGEPAPIVMMRVQAEGDVAGDVRFDDAPDAPVAAFVTDEMETLGFLGSTFTVAPPVAAIAVLRERPPKDGHITFSGVLHSLSSAAGQSAVGVAESPASAASPAPATETGSAKTMNFRLLVAVANEAPAE